jgi:hypothetical protein
MDLYSHETGNMDFSGQAGVEFSNVKFDLFRLGSLRTMVVSPLGLKQNDTTLLVSYPGPIREEDRPKCDYTYMIPVERNSELTIGTCILRADSSITIGYFKPGTMGGISTPFTMLWTII